MKVFININVPENDKSKNVFWCLPMCCSALQHIRRCQFKFLTHHYLISPKYLELASENRRVGGTADACYFDVCHLFVMQIVHFNANIVLSITVEC